MSRWIITVLYEDRHARGEKNYGPHMLLLACVADRIGRSHYALREHVTSIPLSGDGNVKKRLHEDGADLAAAGPLIAMFDDDKVRKCYGFAPQSRKRDVAERIRAEAQGAPTIVLLVKNMEDLLDACCAAMKRPKPATKPSPFERDGILQAAAADGQSAARDQILMAMPSFKCLVDMVCRYVRPDST